MMKNMIVLLVLTLVAGVNGLDCGDGKVHKPQAEATICTEDEMSCALSCCIVGPTCQDMFLVSSSAGNNNPCSANNVPDMSKLGSKAIEFATECCKAEADANTCLELSFNEECAAGTHFLETEGNMKKSASTTNFETCCVADTCEYRVAHNPPACPTGTHYEAANAVKAISDNISFQVECCRSDQKCDHPSLATGRPRACPAGYKDMLDKVDIDCASNGDGVCVVGDCCEINNDLCAVEIGTCGNGRYVPTAIYGRAKGDCCVDGDTCETVAGTCDAATFNIGGTTPATSDTFIATCCKAKATCADFFATSETLRAMPTFVVAAATGIMAVLL